MPRRDDDREIKDIEASLRVSSYTDAILDALQSNTNVSRNVVPDYRAGISGSTSNESSSLFALNTDALFDLSASIVGSGNSADSNAEPMTKTAQAKPKYTLSSRQWNAVQKYPALIEFLGSEAGEKIAQSVLLRVNEVLAMQIHENTKEINKYAHACKAEKHNIKQFFIGDDDKWVCSVIASGPFRGDEAVYFDPERDVARILRKTDENDYKDVTNEFNMVHEFAQQE